MIIKSLLIKIRIWIFNNLKKILSIFKLVLLKNKTYELLIRQRLLSINELIDQADSNLGNGVTGIVFSKNRAFQLDALLESYFEKVANPADLVIIYIATNSKHQNSYNEVRQRYQSSPSNVDFVEQGNNFKTCLLEVLGNIQTRSLFFLVDDIIFIDKVDLCICQEINSRNAILSLRLSPNLKASYTTGMNHHPPQFSSTIISKELLKFRWFEEKYEWSDPWSLDGNIYSTAEIKVLSRVSQFNAPNSYENALKSFSDLGMEKYGYCYKKSKIFNLAINRVQNEFKNFSGNISPDFLLDQWHYGLKMDRSIFNSYIPSSTHEEHEIKFRSRF